MLALLLEPKPGPFYLKENVWVRFCSVFFLGSIWVLTVYCCHRDCFKTWMLPCQTSAVKTPRALQQRTHWRLWPGLLPFSESPAPSLLMFSSFYSGDQGMENQLSILGVHEWRALSHFQVTWNNNGYIWTRQAVSFSIKKDQWKGTKFSFSPPLQHRLEKSRKNWINWVHIILNTLRRYDAI